LLPSGPVPVDNTVDNNMLDIVVDNRRRLGRDSHTPLIRNKYTAISHR
jgi:hypothetical protein